MQIETVKGMQTVAGGGTTALGMWSMPVNTLPLDKWGRVRYLFSN